MNNSRRNKTRILGLVFAVAALACTVDDPQVSEVGTVTLLPVDPSNTPQQIAVSPGAIVTGNRLQTAIWTITAANLSIDGGPAGGYDLLFGGTDCSAADTPFSRPITLGDCAQFLVLEAFNEFDAVQATLMLSFSVRLKRVRPPAYPLIGDIDGDGILNGNDNCVLIANPGQEDTGGLGFGNACRVYDFFSAPDLDSDADGVADSSDNCVHIANPLQVNPPSPDFIEIESTVSDGIGWRCGPPSEGTGNLTGFEEQIVDLGPFDVPITFDFVLRQAQGFLVVDFNDEVVFPNCEWDLGTCPSFDPNAIKACVEISSVVATAGCP